MGSKCFASKKKSSTGKSEENAENENDKGKKEKNAENKKEKSQKRSKEEKLDDSTDDIDKRKPFSGRKVNPETILQNDLKNINEKNENSLETLSTDNQSSVNKPVIFKRGDLIGSGTYGKVYQCLELRTGRLLAVKTIQISGTMEKIKKDVGAIREEIEILKNLSHKNIIKYIHADISDDNKGVDIILEFIPGGSIKTFLKKFGKFGEKVISIYTAQILEGLDYLHKNKIIHRDLKGANILIDTDATIKLSDFGNSKKILEDLAPSTQPEEKNPPAQPKTIVGTIFWMAPEVAMKVGHGPPADIWSLGCVVIEMITGNPPWTSMTKNQNDVLKFLASGKKPQYPNNIRPELKSFLDRCFQHNTSDRATAEELLNHSFIKNSMNESVFEDSKLSASNVSRRETQKNENTSNFIDNKSAIHDDFGDKSHETKVQYISKRIQEKPIGENLEDKKNEELKREEMQMLRAEKQKFWEEEMQKQLLNNQKGDS